MFHAYFTIFLFSATIWLIIFMNYKSNRGTRINREKNKRFFQQDAEANNARRREIDPDLFFIPDLNPLPPIESNDPHQVMRAASRTMIYFKEPISNIELKKQYGPSQLASITQYEENFNDFLNCITKWARDLFDKKDFSSAKLLVEYAMDLNSEYRNTYKLAADLYSLNIFNDKTLESLAKIVEQKEFKDPAMQKNILEYIYDL